MRSGAAEIALIDCARVGRPAGSGHSKRRIIKRLSSSLQMSNMSPGRAVGNTIRFLLSAVEVVVGLSRLCFGRSTEIGEEG